MIDARIYLQAMASAIVLALGIPVSAQDAASSPVDASVPAMDAALEPGAIPAAMPEAVGSPAPAEQGVALEPAAVPAPPQSSGGVSSKVPSLQRHTGLPSCNKHSPWPPQSTAAQPSAVPVASDSLLPSVSVPDSEAPVPSVGAEQESRTKAPRMARVLMGRTVTRARRRTEP